MIWKGFIPCACLPFLSCNCHPDASLLPSLSQAQDESSRSVAGGGISVPGWTGKGRRQRGHRGKTIKRREIRQRRRRHSRRSPVRPATYWNPADKASGNYTVKATFNEPKFLNLNTHPHPYGIVIGGSGMGTDEEKYLYCAAYGNGNFIVRGFGPAPFR